MTSNLFNEFIDSGPEAKLELIESQLIVGNTLVGSRLLLKQILTGWGARAAIALVPIQQPTAELVIEFLQLSKEQALSLVLGYKQQLLSKKLSEATINRRLAAIKALVAFAYRIGQCGWTLAELKGEKVKTYRDTTGIPPVAFKRMLQIPNRRTLKGKRDYALCKVAVG